MFIEQSVARRRLVRLLFVAVGLLPCAALAGVAWWRQSAGHAAAIAREAAANLGVAVTIDRVEHPRPGVMRLSGVAVGGVLAVPVVEMETTVTEVRLRVPSVDCSPAGLRLLADVVGEWLTRAPRYPRSWVVDVGEVAWLTATEPRISAGGWHVECVAADETRAVRLRREPATVEEIRVRRGVDGVAVDATLEGGLPASIVAALAAGGEVWAGALGPHAVVRGTMHAVRGADGWAGKATGAVDGVDLTAAFPGGGRRLRGEATLAVAALEFAASRLDRCDLELASAGGVIAQDVLDGLVSSLGCRPGPAYRALAGDSVRRFDTLSCRVLLDAGGLRLGSSAGPGNAIVTSQGLVVLEESPAPVPATRLAWLLSPAGSPPVPASTASGWLISVLPAGAEF
jgi:hypothetical protein